MRQLKGAALTAHKKKSERENARSQTLALKRSKLEKMQAVYARYKTVSRLENAVKISEQVSRLAFGILKAALWIAPIIVISATVLRLVLWILF